MPHDKWGRLIEPGDLVAGVGYNIKQAIVGTVLAVNAQSESCNIQVLVAQFDELEPAALDALRDAVAKANYSMPMPTLVTASPRPDRARGSVTGFARAVLEYGATSGFEIVRKASGLAPEPPSANTKPVAVSAG